MTEAQGAEILTVGYAILFVLWTCFFFSMTLAVLNRFLVFALLLGGMAFAQGTANFYGDPLAEPDYNYPTFYANEAGDLSQAQKVIIGFMDQNLGFAMELNDPNPDNQSAPKTVVPLAVYDPWASMHLSELINIKGAMYDMRQGPTSPDTIIDPVLTTGTPPNLSITSAQSSLQGVRAGPSIAVLNNRPITQTFSGTGVIHMPTTQIQGVDFPVSLNIGTLGDTPSFVRSAFLWAEVFVFCYLLTGAVRQALVS